MLGMCRSCALQRYLAELALAQQPLPRRQEAESLKFTSGGISQSALVTHEEVQEWATGSRNAIMCSISHAWETREHPDPCRQGTGSPLDFLFLQHHFVWNTSLPVFPTVVSMKEWLLLPGLVWLPCVFSCFLHIPSGSFDQRVCWRNARKCAVAFCLRMWCVTCSRLITLTNPFAKGVGVMCNTRGVEPTDFVDLPCSLFIS